jgi:hypothetical protein
MQHTESRPESKPVSLPGIPSASQHWHRLAFDLIRVTVKAIEEALPLSGPRPTDVTKSELLAIAADYAEAAAWCGSIALIIESDRPRLLPPPLVREFRRLPFALTVDQAMDAAGDSEPTLHAGPDGTIRGSFER